MQFLLFFVYFWCDTIFEAVFLVFLVYFRYLVQFLVLRFMRFDGIFLVFLVKYFSKNRKSSRAISARFETWWIMDLPLYPSVLQYRDFIWHGLNPWRALYLQIMHFVLTIIDQSPWGELFFSFHIHYIEPSNFVKYLSDPKSDYVWQRPKLIRSIFKRLS